jgi:S-adenosylmethionine-dependent methyltransferase
MQESRILFNTKIRKNGCLSDKKVTGVKMSSQEVFDTKAKQWNSTRDLPWNRIRYELTHELIQRHFNKTNPSVLEIGCGNGTEGSLWIDKAKRITVSDYSVKMLETAKSRFEHINTSTEVNFIHSDAKTLPLKINESYDIIMFHNVIEYVEDPIQTLKAIKELISMNGIISIRYLNRYSNPFIPAMYENDLITTSRYIHSPVIETSFGTKITTFTREQISEFLTASGYNILKTYGLIALTGYMTDNEKKFEMDFYQQLKVIELDMADRFPYYDMARFGLILAKI